MSRLERWIVWLATGAVAATGIGYGIVRYLLGATDEFGVVGHPAEPLALKLHVLSAPFLVFALGLIALRHVLAHLLQGVHEGRRSGVAAVASVLPMIASGYGMQVVTDERWLVALAWIHGVTGAVFALGALAHFLIVGLYRRPADAVRADPAAGTRPGGLATLP